MFVVLYAISKIDENKYKELGNSLNFAFASLSMERGWSSIRHGRKRKTEEERLLKALVDKRNARLAEQQRKQNEAMQKMSAISTGDGTPGQK